MDSAFSICSIVIFYSFVKGTAAFLTGKVCSVFFSGHSAYDHALYFLAFILRFSQKDLTFASPYICIRETGFAACLFLFVLNFGRLSQKRLTIFTKNATLKME